MIQKEDVVELRESIKRTLGKGGKGGEARAVFVHVEGIIVRHEEESTSKTSPTCPLTKNACLAEGSDGLERLASIFV